ncbi:hypothetical protein R6Q59_014294 [Mikania micrantha]
MSFGDNVFYLGSCMQVRALNSSWLSGATVCSSSSRLRVMDLSHKNFISMNSSTSPLSFLQIIQLFNLMEAATLTNHGWICIGSTMEGTTSSHA